MLLVQGHHSKRGPWARILGGHTWSWLARWNFLPAQTYCIGIYILSRVSVPIKRRLEKLCAHCLAIICSPLCYL